ncbi:Uncharacterized protein involved in exopolysaccharide biosynthesis [Methylomagnum ishizawai]|uniref:Uncharacterized protein involved in exopolysaccharide biosynthesis n=1 Tax=Methylomagnum ishizawai TaxID=1760988 RepID=A0A1Y6DDV5_9GAMM|nr:hypothetical protein [Methylomagnum ishizawai]SMF97645.1 Uncharacterized protein involved in exopolysaccharide biosynthesis [Methylomagnum ishizawai]
MSPNIKTNLRYYYHLVWRHKHYSIAVALLVTAMGLGLAYSLPKVYRSSAVLLMDVPVSKASVQSTFTEYAGERIRAIAQKVMTTSHLLAILHEEDLYGVSSGKMGQDEIIEFFKKDTDIHILKSELTAQEAVDAIAFNISFAYDNPVTAQRVANRLARLFIEQNDIERTQRAAKVTEFLSGEADKLNKEIETIDSRISAYKQAYKDNLPEQLQGNLAALDRKENELRETGQQIRLTQDRLSFLTVELAKARRIGTAALDTRDPLSKLDSLDTLKAKYLRLSALYSPSHPDVIRLKRQIASLDPAGATGPDLEALRRQLGEARRKREALDRKGYPDPHPDRQRLNQEIAHLERQLGNDKAQVVAETAPESLDPMYLAVETQYKSSQSELESLQQKTVFLKSEIDALHHRILLSPEVEKGYLELVRERDHSVNKYNQLKEKLLDARLVQTLEQEQHGQTLTLLEPPMIPTHPDKTVRKKVALGGAVLGIMAGLGVALLAELLNPKLRGYMALSELTGLMPLVVIPYIESPGEVEAKFFRQRQRRKLALQAGAACAVLAVILICLLVFPAMRESWLLAEFL